MEKTFCRECEKEILLGHYPFCPHGPISSRYAEWDDKAAVVVFRDKDGKYRYPGRNDLPTPHDCERVTLRSLRQVEQHEREAGVISEVAWYDRGSGRGHDDEHRGRKL